MCILLIFLKERLRQQHVAQRRALLHSDTDTVTIGKLVYIMKIYLCFPCGISARLITTLFITIFEADAMYILSSPSSVLTQVKQA